MKALHPRKVPGAEAGHGVLILRQKPVIVVKLNHVRPDGRRLRQKVRRVGNQSRRRRAVGPGEGLAPVIFL